MAASGRIGRTLSKSTAKKQYMERNLIDENNISTCTLSIPRSISSPGTSINHQSPTHQRHLSPHSSSHNPTTTTPTSPSSHGPQQQQSDYKIIVFGASRVGKSALIKRFTKGVFLEHYNPTIEDAYRQVISYNKQIFYLQIIDTSGGYQFPAMHRLSIETGNAFILVYSVTSRESLDSLDTIHQDIEYKRVPVLLVGNKADDLDDNTVTGASTNNISNSSHSLNASAVSPNDGAREITTEEGRAMAEKWQCDGFIETSARHNINVKELFQELIQAERAIQKLEEQKTNLGDSKLHRTRSANKSFRLLSHQHGTGDKFLNGRGRCFLL